MYFKKRIIIIIIKRNFQCIQLTKTLTNMYQKPVLVRYFPFVTSPDVPKTPGPWIFVQTIRPYPLLIGPRPGPIWPYVGKQHFLLFAQTYPYHSSSNHFTTPLVPHHAARFIFDSRVKNSNPLWFYICYNNFETWNMQLNIQKYSW